MSTPENTADAFTAEVVDIVRGSVAANNILTRTTVERLAVRVYFLTDSDYARFQGAVFDACGIDADPYSERADLPDVRLSLQSALFHLQDFRAGKRWNAMPKLDELVG